MADVALGIDVGGTKIAVGAVRGDGSLERLERLPTAATTLPELAAAAARVREGLDAVAVGVGICEVVDDGGAIRSHESVDWTTAQIEDALGPVVLDADVRAAAVAEARLGAGVPFASFVYVTVGTGIGGGVVVGGRPVHGLVHPEMGHVPIPRDADDGFAGVCPYHRGCLEGLASGVALRARWGAAPETLPADHAAWPRQARYLALGICAMTAILSPPRIALGGGVMRAPGLLERVRGEVAAALAGYIRAPELVPPSLGERAGVLGAVALAQSTLDAREYNNAR